MTTWKLVYENRFPVNATTGAPIPNLFRAARGIQTIQAGPVFTLFTGLPGFGIAAGRNITYRLESPLEKLIGVDLSMEFGFVGLFEGQTLSLFSTDSAGLSARLVPTGPPAPSGHTVCRLTLQLDDGVTTIDGLRFRPRVGAQSLELRRLQVHWYTNGQLHVSLDGQLIGYENAFKPGHRFNMGGFSIGDVQQPANAVINVAVTGFRLIELREDSAVEAIGQHLNPQSISCVSDECAKVALALQQQLLRDARKLMAAFVQSNTSTWRQEIGGNPFSLRAVAVHKNANLAGLALIRYLRDGSPESREEAVARFKVVLETLAADQPQAFQQLVARGNEAREQLLSCCQDAERGLRSFNPLLFERIELLNAELDKVTSRLGGGY